MVGFTPLKVAHWESMLADHPDRAYVHYLISGIRESFRVGYRHEGEMADVLSSATQNMHSADENPFVVEDYLETELARGVVLGPLLTQIHVNRFVSHTSQGNGG